MSTRNPPLPSLKLLPLVLSLQAMIKSLSQTFLKSTSHRKLSLKNFLLQAEAPQPYKSCRWAMSLGVLAVRRALYHSGRCQGYAGQGMVSEWKSMKKSHVLSACHKGSLFMCPSFRCQCITASIPFQEELLPIMWTEGMCCQFSHFLCWGRWILWLLVLIRQ